MNKHFNKDTQLSHALAFAIEMHSKFRQTREDNITPYYVHILRVVERLQKTGNVNDLDILMAAALHDVVEDCEVTYEEIGERFGDKVALYVEEVTIAPSKVDEDDNYFNKLRKASTGGKTIKLADKWDNVWELRVQSYPSYGNMAPREYLAKAKIILDACGDAHSELAAKLGEEVNLLEASLNEQK